MAGRFNFPINTAIGNVADPTLATDAATKRYVDQSGGGSSTLQGLTDVQITEPTYSQVGTLVVTSVTSNSVIFDQSVAGIINVGDFIRGSNTANAPSLKVIFVLNNSAQFASDPASYFAINNNCYRLTPSSYDGSALIWNSSVNRWTAVQNSAAIPLDGITWVANNRNVYTTNINTPIITATVTTNSATLTNDWTFATATLPGLVSNDEIVMVDAFGRFATGTYLSASDAGGSFAILTTPLVDRISGGGWTLNLSYVVSIRRGTDALQRYAGSGDVVYSAVDNIGEYPSLLDYGLRYSATATFNQPQNPNTGLAGMITITGFPAGGALKFSVNNPVLIESSDGAWNVSEIYVLSISGTSDPSAVYTMSDGQFNSRSILAAGSYPVIVTLLQPTGVGSVNNLQKNITLAAGSGISINQSGQTINIVNTQGGGGSASTIYLQGLANDNVPGEGFLQSTRAGIAYLGVPMGEGATGGVIQGLAYIQQNSTVQPYGFGLRVPRSLGGTAVAYSDFTVRISMPTFTNITIPVSNTTNNQFVIEPVLVNASYWTSGDPYLRAAQFPLTAAATGDGTSFVPIHQPIYGAITTSGSSATIASISGGYWAYTVTPPNTAYTGTNTDWIVLWAISPSSSGPVFNITGDPTGSQFRNDGNIEIDLELGSSGPGTTPTLAQVLATGNTTGANNLVFSATGKLSGPVGGLSITGGTSGQVLTTDGSGNQSWSTISGTGNPAVWLTGSGAPADSLGVIGNYYQDTSVTTPGNRIWLKTQTTTSPFWARQPNFENAIASYNPQEGLEFGFAYVAATANITLSGLQTIDGVSLLAGTVVLVTAQTNSPDDGLYIASAGAWSRASSPVITQGLVIILSAGTENAGNSFIQSLVVTTVGVSSQSWALFSRNAAPSLQAVTTVGNTTTSGVAFQSTSGTANSITLKAPATLANSRTYQLLLANYPNTAGTPVVCDTGGNLGFAGAIAVGNIAGNNLNISPQTISRTGPGPLSVLAGTNVGDAVVIGSSASSAINFLQVTSGSSTTTGPTVSVSGSSGAPLNLNGGSAGSINLGSSQANYLQVVPSASSPPTLSAAGTPTNLDVAIKGKGSGVIRLGNDSTGSVYVFPNAAGSAQQIVAVGTNSSLALLPNGSGSVTVGDTINSSGFTIAGGLTTASTLSASGPAANLDFNLAGKGSGNLNLGTNQTNFVQIVGGGAGVSPIIRTSGELNSTLVFSGRGTGGVQLSVEGQSIALGPIATTAYTTPLFAANALFPTGNLTAGLTNQVLTSRGPGATPYWQTPTATALNWVSRRLLSTTNIQSGVDSTILYDSSTWEGSGSPNLNYNNGVFTATAPGVYLVTAQLNWDSNTTGARVIYFSISGTANRLGEVNAGASPDATVYTTTAIWNAALNATLTARVWQNSGGTRTIGSANAGLTAGYATYIQFVRLG